VDQLERTDVSVPPRIVAVEKRTRMANSDS